MMSQSTKEQPAFNSLWIAKGQVGLVSAILKRSGWAGQHRFFCKSQTWLNQFFHQVSKMEIKIIVRDSLTMTFFP